ncbi:alpha/beta hydrolase [Amycolatopsis ultiminotia]|uniref:alpha/beta fold hydrolase n=1 Tax=Amycolatopsis ultiminotia TaxID=543629 RepID=UPI0031EA88B4
MALHVVTGGRGPALLLLNGWPQTWYAWRHVMPELARHFTVVAAEPRGFGRSEKPPGGYDTGSLAADLVAVLAKLGHRRYVVAGHDVGMWIGYALAADHPGRVSRLAVAEANIPGVSEPPFFSSETVNNRLFHFGFNRLESLNEALVRGREELYFGHQFATKTAPGTTVGRDAIDHYVETLAAGPEALRASFAPYRALDETIRQNRERARTPLSVPVLAIGGAAGTGGQVGRTMSSLATHVDSRVLADCGHYPAEETPAEFLAVLLPFLLADSVPAHDEPGPTGS